MSLEVMGFETAQSPLQRGDEQLDSKPPATHIKFGSHGDESDKVEAKNNVSESEIPVGAVDEWPAPKKVHSFYFVKYRLYEDPNLKAKLDLGDKEIHKKNQDRFQILEGLKAKRVDRAQVISQLKALNSEDKQFWGIIDGKRKEMEPLNEALGKLRSSNGAKGERGGALCSSEQELDDLIRSLNYRIQHESIPLSEEKQILKDIKQLEQTRDKVIANVAIRTKIQDSYGQKESIQDQVKLMGGNLDGVRKEHQNIKGKKKQLQDELTVIDNGINSLQEQLEDVTVKKDKTYENLQQLRKQRDEGNAHFYQNRKVLNNARDLASKCDVEALEELSHSEVGKFMNLWSSSKGIRDDYEKRILGSLDFRQLSRDGRMRNPDEKPLVAVKEPAPSPAQTGSVVSKTNGKLPKEDSKAALPNDSLATKKTNEEVSKPVKESPIHLEENKEDVFVPLNVSIGKDETDETKLKEIKAQEEREKNELTLKRRKKLAEKSEEKKINKAKQEAEKKRQKMEKKAKKKGSASAPDPDATETTEPVSEVAEPEETNEILEAPVSSRTSKDKKTNNIRSRNLPKASKSLPRAILKRKKATNYWIWAAPVAIAVLVLLASAYHFLL